MEVLVNGTRENCLQHKSELMFVSERSRRATVEAFELHSCTRFQPTLA